jgi:capsular polysaccharide biosynthesis protein
MTMPQATTTSVSEPRSPDERFDLDVGGYARAVVRRWWLVLILVVVGGLTGVLWWSLQPKTYEATAAVYLGQPTDANGNAIVGVNSNPRAAAQIVAGADVVQEAAKAAGAGGMTAKQIRRGLKIETPTITVKSTSAPTNYVSITVRGGSADKTAAAANALAVALVARLSDYATQKTSLLETQLASDEARLKTARAELVRAGAAMSRIASGAGSAADKAAAQAPYATIVQAAGQQVGDLEQKIAGDELALVVVKDVESPAVISKAAPADAPTRQGVWLAVGAGAVAGFIVSLVVVAFLMRRRPAPAAA